jgi:ATP-dependent Clp protease ATP-binding subunit ClpA
MPPRRNQKHDILKMMKERLVGQSATLEALSRQVEIYQAGLVAEGRPAGVFLLLGPTGTGKTHTVEVLAEALHGSSRAMLRIDCAEFQMDHEVAKLIGAPPGYLGHRETQALLNQARLNAVSSEYSDLSILLFDEVEKAAPALTRLLLGILDRAQARLGDNTMVNFERCLIFLTSNLGARQMMREMGGRFGLAPVDRIDSPELAKRLERQAVGAVKRHFSPEFVNRVDAIFTYQPLTRAMLDQILDIELAAISERIRLRLGERAFTLDVGEPMRRHLIETGTSPDYGARELKRVLQRLVLEPVASAVCRGRIPPEAIVSFARAGDGWKLEVERPPSSGRLAA